MSSRAQNNKNSYEIKFITCMILVMLTLNSTLNSGIFDFHIIKECAIIIFLVLRSSGISDKVKSLSLQLIKHVNEK